MLHTEPTDREMAATGQKESVRDFSKTYSAHHLIKIMYMYKNYEVWSIP